MVTSSHEAAHRIFQEHPGLFSGVSQILGLGLSPIASVTVLPTDLTEARPVERRIDTLLRCETEGDGSFLLAVEAQGKKDPDKTGSWAYYLSYLYAKYRLPPLLLVVCQDRATAEWAEQPVHIGPPRWPALTLRPLVAGPQNMPSIKDPAEARKDLALATLSVITHADDPDVGVILKALSKALQDTPEAVADPIVELISQGLGKRPAAQHWRNLVATDLSFYISPISEEIRDEGRAEGRAQGLVEERSRAILTVLEKRSVATTDDHRERIATCTDLDVLGVWLDRAFAVTSADELFIEGSEPQD
ncbi:hypothetical protein ACH41E_07800 [Streptomyces sp. NPDC020412]|uniref:hypothetical protein n=1 Tax=Streptomyces sp. NPDC020412 TaxID=3365073 RepID=UPI0037A3FF12